MRKRLTIAALAKREAEVMALAVEKPPLTLRQIAERMGYADHSGAARASRRCLRRLESSTMDDAQKWKERISGRVDDAAEHLEEIADTAKDPAVRVRALAALAANSQVLGHVTGAIKLPPPVNVNQNNNSGIDVTKLSPEDAGKLLDIMAKLRAGEEAPPKES